MIRRLSLFGRGTDEHDEAIQLFTVSIADGVKQVGTLVSVIIKIDEEITHSAIQLDSQLVQSVNRRRDSAQLESRDRIGIKPST